VSFANSKNPQSQTEGFLPPKQSGGFKRAAGFYFLDRRMYPISFIFDSLRNDVRRFDTTIEAGTQDSLELTRIADRVSTAEAKIAKSLQGPMYFPGHVEIGEKGNSFFLRVLIGTGFQFMRAQERTRKRIHTNENYR
jgi:hypothetical protein